MLHKRAAIVSVALAATIGLGTLWVFATDAPQKRGSVPKAGARQGDITAEQAVELAQSEIGGGVLVSLDKELESGRWLYELELVYENRSYELEMRMDTGSILKLEKERDVAWNAGAAVSATEAKEIALAQTRGGTVVKCRLEREDGRGVYDVIVIMESNTHRLEIGADTGAILEYKKRPTISAAVAGDSTAERKGSGSSDSKAGIDGYITAEQAKSIALERVGGGAVTKCKRDTEDGVAVYEVEVIYGSFEYELEIDAATGAVVKYDKESIYD